MSRLNPEQKEEMDEIEEILSYIKGGYKRKTKRREKTKGKRNKKTRKRNYKKNKYI